MSMEGDIYRAATQNAAISALIEDRFYWDVADASASPPYIVAQVISDNAETLLDGTRGLQFPLIQISAWALTNQEALSVMTTFASQLEGVELYGDSNTSLSFAGQSSSYDSDTRLYGRRYDFRAASNQP